MRVVWTEFARDCLRDQARYIATESCSLDIATKWVDKIIEAAEGLVEFPAMGRKLPEFPSLPYREVIVKKNFRLIYRVKEDVIYVITVRRVSMLLDEDAINILDEVV